LHFLTFKSHQNNVLSKLGELEENLSREKPLFTIIFSLKSSYVLSLSLHYTIDFDPLYLLMETP